MEMFTRTLLLLATLRVVASSDMFTAVVDMQRALHAEVNVACDLRDYISKERQRIDALERIADDFERHGKEALKDPMKHLANPVNAYLLIKRFTVGWENVIEKYMSINATLDFLQNLSSKTLNFPDREDLLGSALALLRLQDVYALPTDQLAKGNVHGVAKSPDMTADDCFQLGVIAYNREDFYHAVMWLSQALEADGNEIVKTADRVKILDYLAYAMYQQGNIFHAYNLTLEWLKLEPGEVRAENNLRFYSDAIVKVKQPKTMEVKNDRILDSYKSSVDYDVYERLCRGEKTHVIKDEHLLICQYRRHKPMFYINPLREEVVHLDPRIVIYHNIITDAEIAVVKELATPKLHRSGVFQLTENDNSHTDYRTSKTAWISDSEHPLIARIAQKAAAMSNLTLDTVEFLQVEWTFLGGLREAIPLPLALHASDGTTTLCGLCTKVLNYGIGGQYEPHFDFARPTEIATFEEWRGNRVATVIFYMTDVEAGGATVFNTLGVRLAPIKGACAIWYNLHRNGDGDHRSMHAGCPVLAGTKWVCNKWFHVRGQEFSRPCNMSPKE